MTNPQLQAQVEVLINHCLDGDGELNTDRVLTVFKAMSTSKLVHVIPLLRAFRQRVSQIEHRQRAIVTAAVPLDKETKEQLTSWLKKQHHQIKSVTWQTNPDLLGGMTIQAGDAWYDVSLQQRLHMIEEQLG